MEILKQEDGRIKKAGIQELLPALHLHSIVSSVKYILKHKTFCCGTFR